MLFSVTTLIGKYNKRIIESVVKFYLRQTSGMWKEKENEVVEKYNSWYENRNETCAINRTEEEIEEKRQLAIEILKRKTTKIKKQLYKARRTDTSKKAGRPKNLTMEAVIVIVNKYLRKREKENWTSKER